MTDARLLAWMVGALDAGNALLTEEAVAASPSLQARVASLQAELVPGTSDRFAIPPPGVRGGRLPFVMRPALDTVMAGETLRPGDRFAVHLEADDERTRSVVVLRRMPAGWEVVFPLAPEDELPLVALPQVGEGRLLELTAATDLGEQRWAVALPAEANGPGWQAGPGQTWASLRAGLRSGEVPSMSLEIRVSAG